MKASRQGYSAIVRFLIKNKAKIELYNKYHRTALMIAVIENRGGIARILLKAGANINTTDERGQTLLMWAVVGNKHKMIGTLLNTETKEKIDIYAKNENGDTVFDLVENDAIADMLHEYEISLNKQDSSSSQKACDQLMYN